MKKTFLPLALAVFLVSCSTPSSETNTSSAVPSDSNLISNTDNSITSPDTIIPPESTSPESTIENPSTSENTSTIDPAFEAKTVLEARQLATTIDPIVGVKRGDTSYNTYDGPTISIEAKYLAKLVDMNHTVLMISDGTASIGVVMEYETGFKKIESKIEIGKCYKFTGKISYYLGRPELVYNSYSESSLNTNIDLAPIAPVKSISEVHEMITALSVNNKGNAFDTLVTIEAQYVAEADDSVMMFYDGDQIIQVHGDRYVNNGRTVGETYKIVASIGRYLYKPSLEFISGTRTEDVKEIEFNNPTPITSAELRAKKYENEEDKIVGNLDVYPHIYSFSGYVSAYVKDSAEYLGLVDNLGDRASDNGTSQPNLSLRLKNHSNLYGRDAEFSVFIPYLDDKVRVENVIFAAYMYNGDNMIKTWQIYSFDDTVTPLVTE